MFDLTKFKTGTDAVTRNGSRVKFVRYDENDQSGFPLVVTIVGIRTPNNEVRMTPTGKVWKLPHIDGWDLVDMLEDENDG